MLSHPKNHSRATEPPARLFFCVCLAGVLMGATSAVRATETDNQLWPEVDAYVALSEETRLFFLVAPVREEGASYYSSAQIGANIDFSAFHFGQRVRLRGSYDEHNMRHLHTRAGYREFFSFNDGNSKVIEQRIIGEITPRIYLRGDVVLALRNRGDWRWISGSYSWRYRFRLKAERESKIRSFKISPYASAEVFYDSRYDSWNRALYEAGVALPVAKWLVPKVYYALQTTDAPSDSRINALGLIAAFYF